MTLTALDQDPSVALGFDLERAIEEYLIQDISPAVKEAQTAIRQRLEGVSAPCMADPDTWTRDLGTREGPIDALMRACRAQDGCLSCHAFVQCSALADVLSVDHPEVTGILAGRFIGQDSKTAVFVKQRLGMEMQ